MPTPERAAALCRPHSRHPSGAVARPIDVEIELHLPIDEHVFVCKLDAVYEVPPGSELAARGIRYQVVDWKTGKAPRDARDLELKQTQLALYRLAYASWAGVAPSRSTPSSTSSRTTGSSGPTALRRGRRCAALVGVGRARRLVGAASPAAR